MKKIFLIIMFCYICVYANDNRGNLSLQINGLKSDKGKVLIALCNSKEQFTSDKDIYYKKVKVSINNRKAYHVFEDIPYGEYAVKIYHDENNNEKLDKSFMGIPKESYGFSNNARGTFGPPKYEDAKFILESKELKMVIIVK